jgi:hypothetical protein
MEKPGPKTHRLMSSSKHRFLYCHDCNAAHRVTPFDSAPVFEMDGMEIHELPQDDRGNFIDRHSGHRIGELIGVGEKTGQAGAVIDPMRIIYIEATDGQESFALRSARKQIADALSYQVLPRQLSFVDVVKTLNQSKNTGQTNGNGADL